MNKRIQQFAINCAGQMEWEFPKDPESFTFNNHELEKFAKLIVRECSKIIVNGGYWNPAFGERRPCSPREIATMIKEHFGVEK